MLEASGLDPGQVSSFLHEHYHSFVDEDAIDDAALALEYLGDSGEAGGQRLGRRVP